MGWRDSTTRGNPTLDDFVIRVQEPPQDASPEEKEAARKANLALSRLTQRLADFDPTAGIIRLLAMVLLAGATTVGGIVAILGAVSDSEATAIAGVLGAVGSLGVGALMNPLQTVERDIIIRRWSDVIISSWAIGLAKGRSSVSGLRQASEEFAKLGSTYAALTSKTLETIGLSFPKTEEDDDEKDEDEKDEDKALSLEVPKAQTTVRGAAVGKLTQATASGGVGPYVYAAEGLPPGLSVTANGGEFVGEVAANAEFKDWNVTVTVTDVGSKTDPKETASDKFIWTVSEAAAS